MKTKPFAFPFLNCLIMFTGVSLVAQMVKSLPAKRGTQVQSLGQEDPLRKKWQPTPVFLPGKSHGQRTLVRYGPWGPKKSDTTSRPTTHIYIFIHILYIYLYTHMGFPGSSAGKESTCKARDPSSIPGLGRSPGAGIGYPFQYA